jgi:hypothetical protein
MSSTYRVLCLSHDPAMVAADGDWNRASMAEEVIAAGVEGHEQCDLLIGRYSYPLVEVGCPASKDRRFKHPCVHGGTQWVDVAWLALLAVAQQDPSRAEAPSALRVVAREAGARCWSPERVRRLGPALGVTAAAESKSAPSDVAELERRLVVAHQSRRASEHLLDGVRRALCDAGFMRDGDPYGHADLADVIRQAGEAESPCGYCNCTTPSAECTTCDHDEASEPAAEASARPVPLTRAAVRAVVLFVGSLVGWIDEVHGDQVDQITDAALAKIGGPAPQQTTDPIDVPEPERARILKQARVHLREYRKTLSTDGDYECGVKDGMLEASWHLTALGRVGDDEFWAAPIPRPDLRKVSTQP